MWSSTEEGAEVKLLRELLETLGDNPADKSIESKVAATSVPLRENKVKVKWAAKNGNPTNVPRMTRG